MSAEHIVPQAPMRDNVQEYIIDMLLSLANMAAETKQTALAARIRSAADSTVIFL